ncbi:MAG: DNA (cytosine-5-)-methyltransferase [Lachnospiraceae bacterium]|nr:DNA (cytosine-5-)-methyltransferase [Lachnospiraceae bacterium]MCM1240470.1 DNA (cytosine-5-)-methyltransferase [Lachnospiraceae bacterium]
MERQLTMGSLFDGIGGFMLAAQSCGITPIWAAEIEPNCISITRRHFPEVMHVGSVTELKGDEVPPVDIITFGSPCQNLSVAGNRKGLAGEESGLFLEAIRIIEEMRESTNGIYPAFIIWENVPGAFSSNDRQDFRTVLEKITKARVPLPRSEWTRAGMVRGGEVDTAWRTFDAEHWGVPQRRRRIYLVGDFGGQRAGEILFKPESLLGYPAQGAEAEKEAAGDAGDGAHAEDTRGRAAGFIYRVGAKARGIGYREEIAPTIKTYNSSAVVIDITHTDDVARVFEDVAPALLQRMGTGGNQVPLIAKTIKENVMPIRSEASRLKESNGLGIGGPGAAAPTLTANDVHGVFYEVKNRKYYEGQQFGKYKESEISGTLLANQAKMLSCSTGVVVEEKLLYAQKAYDRLERSDKSATLKAMGGNCQGGSENMVVSTIKQESRKAKHIIRRLTPRECERLQGYPDDWTRWGADGEEISDMARYRATGNSIAVPCAVRVFRGILSELEG